MGRTRPLRRGIYRIDKSREWLITLSEAWVDLKPLAWRLYSSVQRMLAYIIPGVDDIASQESEMDRGGHSKN
jgi:hypothetical protein